VVATAARELLVAGWFGTRNWGVFVSHGTSASTCVRESYFTRAIETDQAVSNVSAPLCML
jgi:hypothetical protein